MYRNWPFSCLSINVSREDDIVPDAEYGEDIPDLISSFEGLMNSSKSNKPDLERHRDLTATAFESLMGNFTNYVRELQGSQNSELHKHPSRIQDEMDGLKSILPTLRHHVTSPSLSLDPSEMLEDPVAKLGIVLKLILELKENLDSIQILCYSDPPERIDGAYINRPVGILARLKIEILTRLLTDIFKQIHRLLFAAKRMISCLVFPNNTVIQEPSNDLAEKSQNVIQQTSCCWQSIDKLNEALSKSDLLLVQERVRGQVNLLEDSLRDMLYILRLPELLEASSDLGEGLEGNATNNDLPTHQMKVLVRIMVPITKLSRLFLNKLSKLNANTSMFSYMNSKQLSSLLELVDSIPDTIIDMKRSLGYYWDIAHRDRTFRDLSDFNIAVNEPANNLRDCFQKILTCILFPYFESLPSTRLNDKIHPKTWVETWQHQFLAAISKYCSATYVGMN